MTGLSDREILENRIGFLSGPTWDLLKEELMNMADSLDTIRNIEDEKTLYLRRGQVDILTMIINLRETTKLALEQMQE